MKKWIWIIFFIALFLRLYKLSDFPAGFTPDEASQGYTAYSILKTGSDEWGVRLPLTPRSFGDFKSPFQTYLMIPFIAVLGLNEFSVRLPNALLGSLAVLVVYFLVRRLALIKTLKNADSVSLVAAFLLAISPWHISLSRGAFEANLTTFFLPLAVWLFFLGICSPKFLILSSMVFGLNLFTYHSAKIITPFVLLALIVWQRKTLNENIKKHLFLYVVPMIILAGFFVLLGASYLRGAGARAGDIGIFSGGWQAVADLRFFSVGQGLPDVISRIFNNKLTFVWGEFVKNYFSYLSPQFLFTQGAGEATYGMIPGHGVLYLFEAVTILFAVYFLVKEKDSKLKFLFFWVLVSPIPASLARGVGYHANRVAVMMPAIQIFSAYGVIKLYEWAKIYFKKGFIIVKLFYCCIVIFSFVFFLEKYFFYAPKVNASKMGYGWKQTGDFLKNNDNGSVIISRSLSEPQAYIMFFLKIDPGLAQKEIAGWMYYEKEGKHFVDQLGEYSLDKFTFRNFSFPEDWQEENVVLVGTEKDFYGQEKTIENLFVSGKIKEKNVIYYPDKNVAMIAIKL